MVRFNFKTAPLFTLSGCKRCFAPRLIPTLATCIVLPLLLSLGFWQLDRAEQKKILMAEFAQRPTLAPLSVAALNNVSPKLNYRRIALRGHFDNAHTLLLDNRSHQGQSGYQVLTPFVVSASQKIILVNRGWIKRPRPTQALAPIRPAHSQTVAGLLYQPQKPFMLSRQLPKAVWPMVIVAVDWQQIEQLLNKPVYPTMLLLDPQAQAGFIRDWQPHLTTPAKHFGYAVQWFGLSLTLVIIFIVTNTRKIDANTKT